MRGIAQTIGEETYRFPLCTRFVPPMFRPYDIRFEHLYIKVGIKCLHKFSFFILYSQPENLHQ